MLGAGRGIPSWIAFHAGRRPAEDFFRECGEPGPRVRSERLARGKTVSTTGLSHSRSAGLDHVSSEVGI